MSRAIRSACTSSVVAAILLLLACAPSPATTVSTTPPSTSTTPVAPMSTTAAPAKEEPRYGGTLTFIYSEPMGFDPVYNLAVECFASLGGFCNDEMMQGDWAKGPNGLGETDWKNGYLGKIGLETGALAESWELPDAETMVFHLRHGVRFWNKAPVNGREMTSNDVVWSMKREWESPKSFLWNQMLPDQRPKSITALDKYTVEIKCTAASQGQLLFLCGDQCHIYATEVNDYRDWRNLQGTGPYILTDYVASSSLTYQRNPNYFMMDPLHRENRLPYVETLKQLIVIDKSSQLAALRTGKIDLSTGGGSGATLSLITDDMNSLKKECPDLVYTEIAGGDTQIWGRTDKADLPFKDVRVRQALTHSINKQAILNDYYGGQGDLLGTPYPNGKAWADLYIPLEQMPAAVKELFNYTPDSVTKAKKLLADAGYPNGFKTEIICGTADQADFLSIIKENFASVGVDLNIKQLENTVYRSMLRGRTYDQMIYCGCPTASFPWKMHIARLESLDDKAYFETPITRAAFDEANKWLGKDDVKWQKAIRDVTPYILEQCVGMWVPVPWGYRAWWPWLKNYHGEGTLGYDNQYAFSKFVWIDQTLKKSMGH